MSAKQARFAKRAKAMARLYCHRDGTKPGPKVPLHLVFKNVYKGFQRSFLPLVTPLLAQIKAMPNVSGGNTAYFNVEQA
jgi:hypothetical protein